jgi:hypothetical protein
MPMLTQDNPFMPFPSIADALRDQFAVKALSLRAFGLLAEDQEVNFYQRIRPYLETQILECCTRNQSGDRLDREFFWSLELGKRIECLLTIAGLTDTPDFTIALRCLNPNCCQAIEVELSLQELISLQRETETMQLAEMQWGGQQISLRRPIGFDQLAWLKQPFADERSAVKEMLQTLCVAPVDFDFDHLKDDQMSALNQAMEDLDPLVDFRMQVNCPHCEAQATYTIDLGDLALQKLRNAQFQLLNSAHRLASRYHWAESAIFALPAWRRDYYLSLIDREELV